MDIFFVFPLIIIFLFPSFAEVLLSCFGFFTFHSVCNSWVAQRAQQHRAKATALYLCSYYLGAALGGPYLLPFWQKWSWDGVVFGSLLLLSDVG